MKTQWMTLVFVAVVGFVAISTTSAGVISSGTPILTSPGLGVVTIPLILTTTPNNDNTNDANANNNITIATKAFERNDYIDIAFVVTPTAPFSNPGGTTEYRVVESVDNATGTNWSSYTMQIGFGTGANFVVGPNNDGLDFDTGALGNDPPPASNGLPVVSRPNEDTLVFSGGIQGAIQRTYEFRIDIPNIAGDSVYTFTLRQFPTAVPEPTTMAMMAMMLMGFLASRRRS